MKRIAVLIPTFAAMLCISSGTADAQFLKRKAAPAVIVEAAPTAAPTETKDAAIPLHPVVSLFVKQRVIAGLVDKGMTRAKARKVVDEHLTDDLIKASFQDRGIGLPAAPPEGGWLQWLISNLPAILDLITKLIALFGGL